MTQPALHLVAHVTTVDEWARIIKADLQRTTEGIITAGRHLLEAKAEVGHGDWLPLLAAIPISATYAQKFMRISGNSVISNASSSTHLPGSVECLAALAAVPDEALEAAIQDGKITARTTIPEARAFAQGHRPPVPPKPETKHKSDPQVEADLINAVKNMFRPDRAQTYSPGGRALFIQALTQAITNLKECE